MLLYELHLTNFAGTAITIRAIDVVADGQLLLRLEPKEILRPIGPRADQDGTFIPPGMRSVAYVTIERPSKRTAGLAHRIQFDVTRGATPDHVVLTAGAVEIGKGPLHALDPPLRGGPWAAVYDPRLDFGHRRYVYAVRGAARIPGRFAIDWMPASGFRPETTGKMVDSDGGGADVLAVTDATVVTVKRTRSRQAPPDAEDETGNMVVLDLGNGQFAFYQHLADDIRVRVGERAKRGQVIARLGQSGHVTRPHLHFHLADGAGALSSEGAPYRMTAGRSIGRYASLAAFEGGNPWLPRVERALDFPAPVSVVEFPSTGGKFIGQ